MLLLIEVADTSLRYDREVKVPLYARHGIPEIWVIDLERGGIEVYLEPREDRYLYVNVIKSGQLSPVKLPDVQLEVADLWSE